MKKAQILELLAKTVATQKKNGKIYSSELNLKVPKIKTKPFLKPENTDIKLCF
jgi:hypothetical protein